MMKMLIASVCLFALISCGDVDIQANLPMASAVESEQDRAAVPVLFLGSDASRGACAANYERVAPGLCSRSTPFPMTNIAALGCTSRSLSELPVNAKTAVFIFEPRISSVNAVGKRTVTIGFYAGGDPACSSGAKRVIAVDAFEFNATVSTVLDASRFVFDQVEVSSGRNLNVSISESNAGVFINGLALELVGYTD